jgi:hypothetical protein
MYVQWVIFVYKAFRNWKLPPDDVMFDCEVSGVESSNFC